MSDGVDDLENIPTGIPPERLQAARAALGLPAGEKVVAFDLSKTHLLISAQQEDGQVVIRFLRLMDRPTAVQVLRALADRWDLEEMGVSGD